MSISRSLRPRNVTWRAVVLLLLVGAFAFAPIVRAACDIEHVVMLASGGSDVQQAGTSEAPAPDHDGCCDGTASSISADVRPVSDTAAGASVAVVFVAPVWHVQALLRRPVSLRGTRLALVPPEPVFKRVRKLLI